MALPSWRRSTSVLEQALGNVKTERSSMPGASHAMDDLNIPAISNEVERAVSTDGPDGRLAADFAAALFSRTGKGGEDKLPPEQLAQIAINAFAFFKERPGSGRKLRTYDFDDSTAAGPTTVIEAVNDDMPFLLSSILAELIERGLAVRFVAHPIFRVQRDQSGRLTAIIPSEKTAGVASRAESFLHIEIDALSSESARADLLTRLGAILDQVRTVVTDWMPMVSRLREVIDAYVTLPPPV